MLVLPVIVVLLLGTLTAHGQQCGDLQSCLECTNYGLRECAWCDPSNRCTALNDDGTTSCIRGDGIYQNSCPDGSVLLTSDYFIRAGESGAATHGYVVVICLIFLLFAWRLFRIFCRKKDPNREARDSLGHIVDMSDWWWKYQLYRHLEAEWRHLNKKEDSTLHLGALDAGADEAFQDIQAEHAEPIEADRSDNDDDHFADFEPSPRAAATAATPSSTVERDTGTGVGANSNASEVEMAPVISASDEDEEGDEVRKGQRCHHD